MAGNPNALQALMRAFGGGGVRPQTDNNLVPRLAMSDYENQVRAFLAEQEFARDMYKVQDERNYKQQNASKLAEVVKNLVGDQQHGLRSIPNQGPQEQGALMTLEALGGAAVPESLDSVTKMLAQQHGGYVRGGTPTEQLKNFIAEQQNPEYARYSEAIRNQKYEPESSREYNRYAIDPGYRQHLDRSNWPKSTHVDYAYRLAAQRGREEPNEQDLMDAAKIQDPDYRMRLEQSGASGKKMGEDYADMYKEFRNSEKTSASQLQKLYSIHNILGDSYTGKFGDNVKEIQGVANALGINVDNLSSKEAADSISRELALSFRNPAEGAGMPGALSDSDREFLMKMVPSLNMTKSGRQKLIGIYEKVYKRSKELSQAAQNYVTENGSLDSGWDSVASKIREKQLFGDGQIFDPPEEKKDSGWSIEEVK